MSGPRAVRGRRLFRVAASVACGFPGTAFAASDAPISLDGHPLAQGLVLVGSLFLLAAAVGVLRFPDVYVRLHAATKLVTLGGLGIFGGAAIVFDPVQASGRVVLIAAFFFLTGPLSGYMIARSGYLRGIAPAREASSVDEWGACGEASEDPSPEPMTRQMPSASDATGETR